MNVTTVRNAVYEISDRDVCPIKHVRRPGEDIAIKSTRTKLAFEGGAHFPLNAKMALRYAASPPGAYCVQTRTPRGAGWSRSLPSQS